MSRPGASHGRLRLVPAALLAFLVILCGAPVAPAAADIVELKPQASGQPWAAGAIQGTGSWGAPSAIAEDSVGQRIYSRVPTSGGSIWEALPETLGGAWKTWPTTANALPATGPISGDPVAISVGANSPRIYAVDNGGHLREYNPDGAHGGVWSSYDLSAQAGVPNLTGTPTVQRDTAGLMRVYARSASGVLWEFVRSASGSWNATSLSAVATPPSTFPNDPATVMGPQFPEIFAVDARGNLVQIKADFRDGRTWNWNDITATTNSPKLMGRPAVMTTADGSRHVYVRDRSGDLVEFVSDTGSGNSWGSYNLTTSSNGAPKLAYDPAVVTVAGLPRVYATDVQGRLVEFAPDGADGRLWNTYCRSSNKAGPSKCATPERAIEKCLPRFNTSPADGDPAVTGPGGALAAVKTVGGIRVYRSSEPDSSIVDTKDPGVTLSGPLLTVGTLGPDAQAPSLTVDATDIEAGKPQAQRGVERIRIFVHRADGTQKVEATFERTQTGNDKPLSGTWTPSGRPFGPGQNTVVVEVRDGALRETTQCFTVSTPPPPTPANRAAEPGLGFEDWQTFDSTDTGAGSVHRVNLATGNSLWSVTPVSNPGIGFDTSLRLTYNSLEPSALRPDLGAYQRFAYGVAGRGVSVQLGSITRLNEPLWIENGNGASSASGASSDVQRIVLNDGDGTRHVFTRRANTGSSVRFDAPPGVHLELRRFKDDPASPQYWAATRPDGSTFFFYRDGRASEARDRHENIMRLTWEERPDYATSPARPGCGYAAACRYRVSEVLDAAATDARDLTGSTNTPADRKWILRYDAADPMRLVSVDDRKRLSGPNGPVRRRTALDYDTDGRLKSVTAAANAPDGAAKRTWGLGYVAKSAFLERVTDPRGNDTRIRYTAAQGSTTPLAGLLDPLLGFAASAPETRQVAAVADRGSVVSDSTESRERVYRYAPPVAAGQGFAMATWVRDARKVSSRYSMDHLGRLTRLIEDLDDPTRTDDAPASGTAHLQRGTAQTWDGTVNAVASITRGLKGADAPFDAAEATSTEYTWGPLGQLVQETEHKGVAGASPGGTDQRNRSWEYKLHNGTVEGEGDGGREFVYDITKETDRRGKPTTYVYGNDDTGDPQQVNEPGGGEQDFRYNSRGLVIEHSVRQWKGSDNADDSKKPSWAKAADNIPGDVSEKTFATDTFSEFDGNGDARLRVDARGKNWRTGYDDVGNAVLVSDPRAGSLAGTSGSEAALGAVRDPASALTGTLRDSARSGGQPYVARYTFDTLDRQVAVATPKRSAATQGGNNAPAADRFVVTATTYDENDNVTAERDAESQTTLRTFTKTDQISAEQQPAAPQHAEPGPGDPEAWGNGAEQAPVTKFGYDENDDLVLRKDPVPTGDEPLTSAGYRKRWTFDRLGRSVLQVEEGKSAAASELKLTSRAYDLRDNVVAEVDPRTNGAADDDAAIAKAAAGQELRHRYSYDAFDRLAVQVENPRSGAGADGTDVNRTTRWTYDQEDHQTETRSPGARVTQRVYDDRGDLTKVREPLATDTASPSASEGDFATTTITRRVDGTPTEITSPRGNGTDDDADKALRDGDAFRTRFKYFDTGELQRRWLPRVKGQYGPSEWQVRYDINDVGDPVAIRDARGKLVENTFVDTGELATTTRPSWWIYDQGAGSIRERTDDDPAPADASRGSGGLPSEPGNGDFGKVQPQPLPDVMPAAGDTSVAYNDRLQPTTVKGQGDDDGETISQTLDYDRLGRLTRRELPKDPGTEAGTTIELAWQYNVRGLPRAARRLRSSADGNSAVTFWAYDGFDRETKTTEPPSCQGSGCLAPVTTKAYDRNDAVTDEALPAQARTIEGRVGTTTGTRRYTVDLADRITDVFDESGAHTRTVLDVDDLATKRYSARAFVADDGTAITKPKEDFATTYRNDGAGRVTRTAAKVTDPEGGSDGLGDLVTSTTYDREGNPIRVDTPGARNSDTAPSGDPIAPRTTSRVYDARGLLWKSTIGEGENKATTITEYDGAGNLRRTVNPKGVKDPGDGATPRYADEGDIGTTGRSAWHATLQTYDADQGLIGRTMPWGDGDGGAADEGRHRYRQEFERSKRGLVSGITEIFDATGGDAPRTARADTQIERNLAGWPIKSTDRRLDGSTWKTVGAPLKYDYDQLGNQKLWSSIGDQRTIQRSFYRSGQLRVKCGRRTAGGSQEQVYSYRYNNGGALTEVVDWMHRSATPAGESCQPEGDDASTLGIRKTAIARDRAERPTVVNETWDTGKDTAIRYFGSVPNLVSSVQTDGRVSGTNGSTYDGGKSTAYSYDQQDRNTQVRVRDDGDLSGTPDRTTDMAWWPSGERRSTKKPKTASDARTVDSRFYNSRGEVVQRRADPASGITKSYVYTYDENGNRTKDERGKSEYNARDQLTKWDRIRRKSDGTAMPASGENGYLPPSAVSPDKTTTYSQIDGAGRAKVVKEEITAPQAAGMVKTIIDTTNSYEGDRLVGSKRDIRTQIGNASPSSPSKQADCFVYDVFGSQTQTSRQSNYSGDPTPCGGSDASDPQPGALETRNVFDTFERHTAGRQRNAESGDLNGTQAFCYDPLDRRDRRVAGLTGADDPAAASDEGEGRTRAQAACTKDVDHLPSGAVAFDYSYVGLTEQLSRETRSGREQKYDYTASGERLGRLKGSGSTKEWRAYDTDAQGTVVGLEKPTNGQTTPDVDPETGKEKLNTYETDPFGAPVGKESDISDEASANPFRFQGFYNDPETGTYDMQARTYQPSTGRFLQQDRFENPSADLMLAEDPLTSSRYAFTAGNPGTRSEYDGHTFGDDTAAAARNRLDKGAIAKDKSPGKQLTRPAQAANAVFQANVAYDQRVADSNGQSYAGPKEIAAPIPRPEAYNLGDTLAGTLAKSFGTSLGKVNGMLECLGRMRVGGGCNTSNHEEAAERAVDGASRTVFGNSNGMVLSNVVPFARLGGLAARSAGRVAVEVGEAGTRAARSSKGWRRGDDVYARTAAGNEPAWSTVRGRYWKNQAHDPAPGATWSEPNLARMKRGLAPQQYNPDRGVIESMELHHDPIPRRDGGRDFVPLWPSDHAAQDPHRFLGGGH